MRVISFITVFLLGVLGLQAQTQDSYDYYSEFTWGINKNTSSGLIGGFVFKKAKKLTDNTLETYGLEVINIRHPQELRRNSLATGNFFIYGKSNYLYTFRFQYGRDWILFKKAPQQGVEVKLVTAVGPSLGIVAPYYVEYASDRAGFQTINGQYNPSIPAESIYGTGHIFEGLGESTLKFGGNIKAALNFELGIAKSQVTGFEVGFLMDAYTSEVVLVPTAKNYAVYPTLFITLFYGSRK